jgi:hypothetical protein
MICDITMHNPACLVLDYYQDVEQPECSGDYDTEITGQNGCGVIANKGRPALVAARASWWVFGHIFSYRAWRDANTQLEQQFIGNASFPPQVALLFAMLRISCRSSTGIGGRPGRDFQRQNRRKP